jgi:crooked neck
MPELLWKTYIDFEVGQNETGKARELHERLLERTLHVKVQRM